MSTPYKDDKDDEDNAEKVRSHYASRVPKVQQDDRENSEIILLRNYNNFVKSVLIRDHTNQGDYVLDLCCGTGGDLLKFKSARIAKFVGIDLVAESLKFAETERRIATFPFDSTFICANCFREDLYERISKEVNWFPARLFNVVNCQFALHYSFESEHSARQFINNVSRCLKPGGYFIGTFPDATELISRLQGSVGNNGEYSFGNPHYGIEFERKEMVFPRFGCKYTFGLADAVDNCPEYLVHFGTLQQIAQEAGLELVPSECGRNFHPFIHHHLNKELERENSDLALIKRVIRSEQRIPEDQWDALGIYQIFVFKKR